MMTVGVFIMKASNHMISPIKDKVNTLEIRLAYKKIGWRQGLLIRN